MFYSILHGFMQQFGRNRFFDKKSHKNLLIKLTFLFSFLCFSLANANDEEILKHFESISGEYSLLSNLSKVNDLLNRKNSSNLIECGVVNVSAVVLKKITPKKLYFKGVVEVMDGYTVSSDKEGIIEYISNVGDYIFCRIVDNEGKVIREGTAIASLDEADLKLSIKKAKDRKKLADMGYSYLKKMTKAQENLAEKKIITAFEIEAAKINLFSSLLQYESELSELDDVILNTSSPNVYSTISGRVKEVFVEPGLSVSKQTNLALLEPMDPIVVKVKCPVELLDIKKVSTTVLVYPVGERTPIVSIGEVKEDDVNNFYINVSNKIKLSEKLTSREKKLSKITSVYEVRDFLNTNIDSFYSSYKKKDIADKQILLVPIKSIRYDERGSYVYKIEREGASNRAVVGNNNIFKVTKTPIKLHDMTTYLYYNIGNMERVRWVSGENISQGDFIVGEALDPLKDGEQVMHVSVSWDFFPGQTVKVTIPSLTRSGYYVPNNSIIHQDDNENYVYTIKNGVVRLCEINVQGFYDNYCIIAGKNIKEGEKIVILDNKKLYSLLYDGRKVKITNIVEPPVFISKKHAKEFRRQEEIIAKKDLVNESLDKKYYLGEGRVLKRDKEIYNKFKR